MHKLLKGGAAAATATALLAVSLMTGPAADAATTHAKTVTDSIKVGSHTDKLVFTPVGKKTVSMVVPHSGVAATTEAAKYKVVLKHGKKVLYTKTVSTYPAINASFQLESVKHKYGTDTSLKAAVKSYLKESAATAKANFGASIRKFELEYTAIFTSLLTSSIKTELKTNPDATWSDFGFTDPSQLSTYDATTGDSLVITGTPQDYTLSITSKYTDATYLYTSVTGKVVETHWVNYVNVA